MEDAGQHRQDSYFGFGKLDGWIADTVAGGFLVDLETDKEQRAKLARKLTWLEKRQNDPSIVEARNNGRIIPQNPHSTVIFADGIYRDCFIVDMSASGAAVSADVTPDVSMPLAIGSCVGRVVRHFREGFAVKSSKAQNEAQLEKLVARPIRRLLPQAPLVRAGNPPATRKASSKHSLWQNPARLEPSGTSSERSVAVLTPR